MVEKIPMRMYGVSISRSSVINSIEIIHNTHHQAGLQTEEIEEPAGGECYEAFFSWRVEERLQLVGNQLTGIGEHNGGHHKAEEKHTGDGIIVANGVVHGVASNTIPACCQLRMQECVFGKESFTIVLRQVDVSWVTASIVSGQVQGVRLITVMNLVGLEPRLYGRVLLGGSGILRQHPQDLIGCLRPCGSVNNCVGYDGRHNWFAYYGVLRMHVLL